VQKRNATILDVPADIRTVGWYLSGEGQGRYRALLFLSGIAMDPAEVWAFLEAGIAEMVGRIEVFTQSGN